MVVALASAVTDDALFDPAWIFWVPVALTLEPVPVSVGAMYASVVALSQPNAKAAATLTSPSAVLALSFVAPLGVALPVGVQFVESSLGFVLLVTGFFALYFFLSLGSTRTSPTT